MHFLINLISILSFVMHIPINALNVDCYHSFQTIIEMIFTVIFYPATKMKFKTTRRKYQTKLKTRNQPWRLRSVLIYSNIIMNATTTYHNYYPIDTDSESIGIDNRATACISHCIDDFIGELVDTRRTIIGYNNTKTCNLKKGTLRWKWTDDEGLSHTHIIPNSFYSPEGRCRLLSPQHWAQSSSKKAYSITSATDVTLVWNEGKNIKTIPLGPKDNVATMYSTPGYEKFHTFLAQAVDSDDDEDQPIFCQRATSIIEDEDNDAHIIEESPVNKINNSTSPIFDSNEEKYITTQLELQQKVEHRSMELLHYHNKYGHIPFARLKVMAKQGQIPKYLANTPPPACIACMYGRATKKPWKHRSPKNKHKSLLTPVKNPGDRVSVDMLQSPHPGFIAQMTGILTRRRYHYATIYIDNYSAFSYIHLQKTATIEETLESKRAFEAVAKQHGVSIKSYHADNGIFRANKWIADCNDKHQSLTFAGVNAHHQNGRAERRIRLLQELTRTQMIYLKHK